MAHLFVGQLPFSQFFEADLHELFRPFGTVLQVRLRRKKGEAFVTLAHTNEADDAIRALHGKVTLPPRRRPLQVMYANTTARWSWFGLQHGLALHFAQPQSVPLPVVFNYAPPLSPSNMEPPYFGALHDRGAARAGRGAHQSTSGGETTSSGLFTATESSDECAETPAGGDSTEPLPSSPRQVLDTQTRRKGRKKGGKMHLSDEENMDAIMHGGNEAQPALLSAAPPPQQPVTVSTQASVPPPASVVAAPSQVLHCQSQYARRQALANPYDAQTDPAERSAGADRVYDGSPGYASTPPTHISPDSQQRQQSSGTWSAQMISPGTPVHYRMQVPPPHHAHHQRHPVPPRPPGIASDLAGSTASSSASVSQNPSAYPHHQHNHHAQESSILTWGDNSLYPNSPIATQAHASYHAPPPSQAERHQPLAGRGYRPDPIGYGPPPPPPPPGYALHQQQQSPPHPRQYSEQQLPNEVAAWKDSRATAMLPSRPYSYPVPQHQQQQQQPQQHQHQQQHQPVRNPSSYY